MKKIIILTAVVLLAISTAAIAANSNVAHLLTTASENGSRTAIESQIDGSDSVELLRQNANFKNHGFEIKELNENLKINKSKAINIAREVVGEKASQEAKFISAVKVKFTDNETPQLPESKIVLKDYPVWIVTFHGVTLEKNGLKRIDESKSADLTVCADENVVIDANSGEEIETFSYPSNVK